MQSRTAHDVDEAADPERLHSAADPEPVGAAAAAEAPVPRWRAMLGIVLGMLILGGLSGTFLLVPIDWDAIGAWGYLGVFGVVLVATASVALPIPYLLVVARAGGSLDPLLLALVAGLAGVIGELAGYLIGIGGGALLPHGRLYDRAKRWLGDYGFWCVAFFACVPNPFFDAIGVVAGALRYSWWRFAAACFFGKSVKFFIAALIGIEVMRRGW